MCLRSDFLWFVIEVVPDNFVFFVQLSLAPLGHVSLEWNN